MNTKNEEVKEKIKITTSKGQHFFDAVIVCTGFDVNLLDRPEIASFRKSIDTWRSHVSKAEARKFPDEARFPYLGDAFQLQGKGTVAIDAGRRRNAISSVTTIPPSPAWRPQPNSSAAAA